MTKFRRSFFHLDEKTSREFDFSIFIILLCITFRNYFRGYGFAIHLEADLFFEILLLLTPITLLFFNKMPDKEVANLMKYKTLLFPLFGGLIYIILSWGLLYVAYYIPIIDVAISLIGLVFLIAGIFNVLIVTLMLSIKKRVQSQKNDSVRKNE